MAAPKDLTSGLTAERLREVLSYDPETGGWAWRQRRGRRATVGGIRKSSGYCRIGIDGGLYRSSRLGTSPALVEREVADDHGRTTLVDINQEIKIRAMPDRVYEALTTVGGIESWHTLHVEGNGGVDTMWRFSFSGRPEFRWLVLASTPMKRVAWKCVQGPGDAVGTTATFDISPTCDDRPSLNSLMLVGRERTATTASAIRSGEFCCIICCHMAKNRFSSRGALIEGVNGAPGVVDCMVALPGQLFYSTQIPVCLWCPTSATCETDSAD